MKFGDISIVTLLSLVLFWLIVAHRWHRQSSAPILRVMKDAVVRFDDPPLISVIVPARNESQNIETCIRSLLAQNYPRFEVIAVDDCSEDDTGNILVDIAKQDSRLTVVDGQTPPDGWMGKAHAIYQGYRLAKGEYILFTDADTLHAPYLLSGVMRHFIGAPEALATVVGRQRQPTVGVYLANLSVFTYIFMVTDRKSFADPKSPQSLVNGQYVIVTRDAYECLGTHKAVREYSSTDVSLGYLAKLNGYRLLLVYGGDALVTTMYKDLLDAFQGWSRSLVNGIWTAQGAMLGSFTLVFLTAGMGFFWLMPWLFFAEGVNAGNGVDLLVGALLIGAGAAVNRLRAGYWLGAIKDTVVMPVAVVLFIAMSVYGLSRAWWFSGTVWKGRVVRTSKRLPAWKPSGVVPKRTKSDN